MSKTASQSSMEAFCNAIGSLTWDPTLNIAKSSVLSILSQIKTGSLLLIDEPSQKTHMFGQKCIKESQNIVVHVQPRRSVNSVPQAKLVVKKEEFWIRLFLFADMGFAEAYMLEDFECQDLTSFFQLFIVNRKQLNNGTTWFSKLSSMASHLARSTNTLSNALLNVSAHYDISNTMFAAFLSPDMTYSCPIWSCGQLNGDELLQSAQMRKLVYFIDGAKIQPSDHVLEIGTGWGSFAIEAVRKTGCRVTTITLSNEQRLMAKKRIEEAGLSHRIEVRLEDYRQLPIPTTLYDKIVSIEMLEAVGQDYLATYFDRVHRLLKPNGGIAMFQCITMPEGRHEAYSKSKDFINRYIFPGGYLPSITQILDHINRQSQGSLIIEKVENIGGHYAKTLRLWRENFLGRFENTIRPALLKEHPEMTQEGIHVFRRKWEYYFSYCEAGFLTKTLGDVIVTVAREGSLELMDKIPL